MIENWVWKEKCKIEFQMIQQQLNCISHKLRFLVGHKIILHLCLWSILQTSDSKWLNFDVWNTSDNAVKAENFSRFHIEPWTCTWMGWVAGCGCNPRAPCGMIFRSGLGYDIIIAWFGLLWYRLVWKTSLLNSSCAVFKNLNASCFGPSWCF